MKLFLFDVLDSVAQQLDVSSGRTRASYGDLNLGGYWKPFRVVVVQRQVVLLQNLSGVLVLQTYYLLQVSSPTRPLFSRQPVRSLDALVTLLLCTQILLIIVVARSFLLGVNARSFSLECVFEGVLYHDADPRGLVLVVSAGIAVATSPGFQPLHDGAEDIS